MFKTVLATLAITFVGALSSDALAQSAEATEEVGEPDPGTQVHVRLLTHFHKPFSDSGWGIGGWVIMPDIVTMGTTPLFLVGPRYQGNGAWVEVMAGGLVAPDLDPANAGYTRTKTVQSTRFQLTPKFFDSPINMFGMLQFIDVGGKHHATEQNTMMTYTFLMADYVVGEGDFLVGIETENYFGKLNPAEAEAGEDIPTFTDIGVGPQVVFPFHDLNIIMSYQLRLDENTENQMWLRAMYNFGPKPAQN